MNKDKEVWIYADGKPLCKVEPFRWEWEKDEGEDRVIGKRLNRNEKMEWTIEKRIKEAKKSFVEAWEENIDKELTDRINRDVEKMICNHNLMLIQTPAGNPFVNKYICSKCYEKIEHVNYPNVKKEGEG